MLAFPIGGTAFLDVQPIRLQSHPLLESQARGQHWVFLEHGRLVGIQTPPPIMGSHTPLGPGRYLLPIFY